MNESSMGLTHELYKHFPFFVFCVCVQQSRKLQCMSMAEGSFVTRIKISQADNFFSVRIKFCSYLYRITFNTDRKVNCTLFQWNEWESPMQKSKPGRNLITFQYKYKI